MTTTVDEYITHPAVIPKLDEATTVAIRYIRTEMEIRPCVSGCESFEDLHDFTDANMFLAEAFEKVVGREPRVGLQTDIMFLNELARRLDVWLALRGKPFTEDMALRLVNSIYANEGDMYDLIALVDSAQNGTLPAFIREQPAFN
jgi:hypothetical protein